MNRAGEPRVRILVVDDHPMVREGLRGMLSTASNLEVVGEAGTAYDAVAQAQALQPDVILLDIQLPDMDGVTVLPQLKRVAATAHVLMVTMHEETAYMLQAVMAGAAGYILKGVRRPELLAAIQTAVAGHTVTVPVLLGSSRQPGAAVPLSPPQAPCPTDTLRPVERELLGLLARGLSNTEIGVQMRWSLGTVKRHVRRLYALLQVRDRPQAVAEAMRRRLID
jgi:DNA-binding NarL/FixJ family response regulator